MTRRAPVIIVLIIYNTGAFENYFESVPSPEIALFLKNTKITENLWKPTVFKQFLLSQQFTSGTLTFFLLYVQCFLIGAHELCSSSAVVLTIFFSPVRLRPFIYREARAISTRQLQFSSDFENMLPAAVPLIILTKHIVRLRCRCSCEIYSTSAVPLFVIHETSVKLS